MISHNCYWDQINCKLYKNIFTPISQIAYKRIYANCKCNVEGWCKTIIGYNIKHGENEKVHITKTIFYHIRENLLIIRIFCFPYVL